MSSSSDDVINSTESDCEYDSEHDRNVYMSMEDDVDPPDAIDLDGHVDMTMDGDGKVEEDEEGHDEEKQDKVEDSFRNGSG
jgi:hypothetical protein